MFREALPETHSDLTIRRLGAADREALRRLAQRDSAAAPEGTVYGAVSADGSLLAAISLEGRDLVADPFVPTADAATILGLYARQLTEKPLRRSTFRSIAAVATDGTAAAGAAAC